MRTNLARLIPRLALLLAGALPALLSAQVFTEADWPTRGRNAERHYSTPFELGLNAQGRLNLKWKRFFGERIEIEMEPVVVGDTVYLGVMNGKFYALDRETGAVRWVFAAGGAISDTPTACFAGDALRLVFGAHDGRVYCLDAAGALRWSFAADGPVMMTPAVQGSRVLVGTTTGTFYGLALEDGAPQRQVWAFPAGAPLANTPALGETAAGVPAVFFATGANTAFALDPTTGAELWRASLAGAFSKHIMAVSGVGSGGKRVVCFLTRKPGLEYSEPRENLPAILQGTIQPGPVVLEAWADYYHQYPKRRPTWWLDAATGGDLWDYAVDKTRYTPLYLPYWGLHTPVLDAAGRAWLPATGSGGDHALEHDIRLWRMDLESGSYEHFAYETEFQARADEIGRPTLIGTRFYSTISEDIAYFDTATRAENVDVFGNGIFNHRFPIEIDDFEHGRLTTPPFAGRYKHFSRFGSSSPAGYAGAVDATSPLVAARARWRSTSPGAISTRSRRRRCRRRSPMARIPSIRGRRRARCRRWRKCAGNWRPRSRPSWRNPLCRCRACAGGTNFIRRSSGRPARRSSRSSRHCPGSTIRCCGSSSRRGWCSNSRRARSLLRGSRARRRSTTMPARSRTPWVPAPACGRSGIGTIPTSSPTASGRCIASSSSRRRAAPAGRSCRTRPIGTD